MTRGDLALRYALDERAPALLQRGVEAAEKAGGTSLKLGQVKGLVRQVEADQGVEHVANWLRYQSAREGAWQESELLSTVLGDFRALEEDAKGLTDRLYPGRFESELPAVWLALVRRYVLYFHRKFTTLRKDAQDE